MPLDQRPQAVMDAGSVHTAMGGLLAAMVGGSGAAVTGVGVDLVDIAAFTHNHAVGGNRWLRKLFCDAERLDAGEDLTRLATTFAAKEAVVKALGTGFRGVSALDVHITRDPAGQPVAHLAGQAALVVAQRNGHVLISITKEGGYALAAAVLTTAPAATPIQGDAR